MDSISNISENQMDVGESTDVWNQLTPSRDLSKDERPIGKELMLALNLATNAGNCPCFLNSKGHCSCACYNFITSSKECEVLDKEEVVTTSNDYEKGDVQIETDKGYSIQTSVEGEKSKLAALSMSNDVNLIAQSYYITTDEKTGEKYAILTLNNSISGGLENMPVKEGIFCFSNESDCEHKINDYERKTEVQSHSQEYSPHLILQNKKTAPSNVVSQLHRSYECSSQDLKRSQPCLERPLNTSTPLSSNNFLNRMSSSSCYSSVNLNSGGEETSSSDNASFIIPRVPQNTPVSNTSMTSPIPPPSHVPLTLSAIEPPNSYLGDFRLRLKPAITSTCPKEIHNEKERFRRGRIKKSCHVLKEIVPGLSEKTDKATVLETTVRYLLHLKKNAAQDLDQVFLENCFQF